MTTDEDVRRADNAAEDARDYAKRVRRQAVDDYREAAENERDKARALE